MRYRPDNQLSKSSNLQRSLQKGRFGLPFQVTGFPHMGQRMAAPQLEGARAAG